MVADKNVGLLIRWKGKKRKRIAEMMLEESGDFVIKKKRGEKFRHNPAATNNK